MELRRVVDRNCFDLRTHNSLHWTACNETFTMRGESTFHMKGSLSDINVADLVAQSYFKKYSGILRLTQDEVKKNIYFKEGSIVFGHSNLKSEKLGEILVRLGKITEEELKKISLQAEGGKRLGKILLDKGILSRSEISSAVSYQVQHILYSVFNWDTGVYEFVERERPVFEELMVEVSTPNLLIDGVRNINNLVVLQRVIGNMDGSVAVLNAGARKLQRSNLDFSEEAILSSADGKKTLAKMKSITRLPPIEFGRAIYSLVLSGMIKLSKTRELETEERIRAYVEQRSASFTTKPLLQDELPAKRTTMPLPQSTGPEIQPKSEKTDEFSELTFDLLPDPDVDALSSVSETNPADSKAIPEEKMVAKTKPQISVPTPQEPSISPTSGSTSELTELRPERTTTEMEELLKQEPRNMNLLRQLGIKLQQEGKAREAEKYLLRALEVEPQNIDNHFAMVDFYKLQGLKFKVFRHLNIVLQLDPDNQRALDMLGLKKRKRALYEISPDRD